MQLSFHTQIAGGDLAVAEAVGPMAEAGMTQIESRSRAIDWFSDERETSVRRTQTALRAAGVELYSVHAPFGEDVDWCSTDCGAARAARRVIEFAIRSAGRLGAAIVVVHGSRGPADETLNAVRARIRTGLESLLPHAEAGGLRLALENMRWEGQSSADVLSVVEALDSPHVTVCLDTGHANIAGDPVADVRMLGERLGHLHIHDNDGTSDQHLMPPGGNIDWAAFRRALDEVGFDGPLNFELRPAADAGATLTQARLHLERLFGVRQR